MGINIKIYGLQNYLTCFLRDFAQLIISGLKPNEKTHSISLIILLSTFQLMKNICKNALD